MILEGIVMPVGQLNANGWGITPGEIANTIQSLKQSVVRLCPDMAHGCDITESKPHEIGAVIDAWYDGININAKTKISNQNAKSMVKTGKVKAWSVYGQGDQQSDGFVVGYKNKSLTLVADPAWKSATFNVAASKRFTLTNSFSKDDIMPEDSDEAKFLASLDQKIADSQEATKKEVGDLIASKDKQITDLSDLVKKQAEDMAALVASLKPKEDNDKTDKKDDPVFASKEDLDAIKGTIKTDADIDKLVASRLAEANEAKALESAIVGYKEFAASKNLKIEDASFVGKTSVMINAELAMLKTVSASVSLPEPMYHSIPDEFADDTRNLTVGIPDGKGGWK